MHGRSLRLAWLGIVVGAMSAMAFAHGCGGDDEGGDSKKGGTGGKDATTDQAGGTAGGGAGGAGATGGTGGTGGNCQLNGATCADNSQCCTLSCDQTLKVCTNPPGGECGVAGASCALKSDCCTLVCDGGKCGATQCTSDNQACTSNAQCCSDKCGAAEEGGAQVCIPINTVCKTAGNTCTTHTECCGKMCSNGICSLKVSFCTQTGDLCSSDAECCVGICTKASGATVGSCTQPDAPGTTGCLAAGEVCGEGANIVDGGVVLTDAGVPACGGECCSRACAPYGPTGVFVCQPPSGCRPTGELCKTDLDCCGAPGVPGGNGSVHCSKADPNQPVGKCDNGGSCRPNGAVCKLATGSCNAENNCCTGNVNQDPTVCKQDNLGIPRCTEKGACPDGGVAAGTPCATSADCCGLPCLPNLNAGDGGAKYICGSSCVPAGGTCTTDADCCAGLPCTLQPGSTQGTCGVPTDGGVPDSGIPDTGIPDSCTLYGQLCKTSAECCAGVPCTCQGEFCRCVYPVQ